MDYFEDLILNESELKAQRICKRSTITFKEEENLITYGGLKINELISLTS